MKTPSVIPNDRPVVVVDTVVDTGATLEAVCKVIPNVVVACALVIKEEKMQTTEHKINVPVLCSWYVKGDPWLLGYGLDHDSGRYRGLPYLGSVEPKVQLADKA
jgi:hypoxanthine-guanine phosphoribosyltransferase